MFFSQKLAKFLNIGGIYPPIPPVSAPLVKGTIPLVTVYTNPLLADRQHLKILRQISRKEMTDYFKHYSQDWQPRENPNKPIQGESLLGYRPVRVQQPYFPLICQCWQLKRQMSTTCVEPGTVEVQLSIQTLPDHPRRCYLGLFVQNPKLSTAQKGQSPEYPSQPTRTNNELKWTNGYNMSTA